MKQNLNWYIKKYGDEEGSRRFLNRKNTINTLEWYIDKYGDDVGKLKYEEKNKRVGKKSENRNTLEGFISRFGEEEGKKRYDEFVFKSKHTKNKYIELYGEEEGNQKWEEYIKMKKLTSKRSIDYWLKVFDGNYELALENLKISQSRGIDFYVDRYGEKEGNKKWENRKKDQSNKISKLMLVKENRDKHILSENNFILKYGDEEGKLKWKDHLSKRKNFKTLYNEFIEKYGEEEGNQKWKEFYVQKMFKNINYSSVSQSLFNEIYEKIDDHLKNSVYYATLNKEFFIRDDKNIYFYDFVVKDVKLIFEFHGDFWHANPKIYKENFIHPIKKITAKEIWLSQNLKNLLAINNGYDVIEIWENDYRNKKQETIDYCLDIIKNKI